jgi:hypothetical protein
MAAAEAAAELQRLEDEATQQNDAAAAEVSGDGLAS